MDAWERLFSPDETQATESAATTLQKILTVLQAQSSNPAINPNPSATGKMVVSLPIPYDQLMQIILASGQIGQVFPLFVRQDILVPAGSEKILTLQVDEGDTASAVYLHKMRTNVASSEFFVSVQADNSPYLVLETAMTYPIDIMGAFLPPVSTRGTWTLINNDSQDITFTQETQFAIMTPDFVQNVWRPFTSGQLRLVQEVTKDLQAGS